MCRVKIKSSVQERYCTRGDDIYGRTLMYWTKHIAFNYPLFHALFPISKDYMKLLPMCMLQNRQDCGHPKVPAMKQGTIMHVLSPEIANRQREKEHVYKKTQCSWKFRQVTKSNPTSSTLRIHRTRLPQQISIRGTAIYHVECDHAAGDFTKN